MVNERLMKVLEKEVKSIQLLERLEYQLWDFIELRCLICPKTLDERLQCRGCRREFKLVVERE